MKFTIHNKVAFGFILAFVIIVCFASATFLSMNKLIVENEGHRQALQILKSIDRIKEELIQAEAEGRKYALSGNKQSLDAYNKTIHQVESDFIELDRILPEDLSVSESKKTLNNAFHRLILLANEVVTTRQSKGINSALTLLLDGNAAELGNKVMSQLQQIETGERAYFLTASQNNIKTANRTIYSFVILVLIILFLLIAIYYLLGYFKQRTPRFVLCI